MVVLVPCDSLANWEIYMETVAEGVDPGAAAAALGEGYDGTPNSAIYATSSGTGYGVSNAMVMKYTNFAGLNLSLYSTIRVHIKGQASASAIRFEDALGAVSSFIVIPESGEWADFDIQTQTIEGVDLTQIRRIIITVFTFGALVTKAVDNIEGLGEVPPPVQRTVTVSSTPINVPVTVNGSPAGNTPMSIVVDEGSTLTLQVPSEVDV